MKRFIKAMTAMMLAASVVACNQPSLENESARSEEQISSVDAVDFSANENQSASLQSETARYDSSKALGVIMIHGWGNVFDNQTFTSNTLGDVYWIWWTKQLESQGLKVKQITWDTKRRVDPASGTQFQEIVKQYMGHINAGHCKNGCVTITHSTGGLVMDLLLSHAQDSRGTKNDFSAIYDKTIAGISVASAAGGVEATDIARDVIGSFACKAYEGVLGLLIKGFNCNDPGSLGATYDLNVNQARKINRSDDVRTPILNIAGYGNFFGNPLKPVLAGTDDGVVAMHSACGGNKHGSFDSCVANMGPDGQINNGTYKAPANYKTHYPFIMTGEGHGSQLAPCLVDFALTDLPCVVPFVDYRTETLVMDAGLTKLANESRTTGALWWKQYYKRLPGDNNGQSGHLSNLVINGFNFNGRVK